MSPEQQGFRINLDIEMVSYQRNLSWKKAKEKRKSGAVFLVL